MAPTSEALPGGLDALPLGDRCACGNVFMSDAVFCRKCGCKRGTTAFQDADNNDQVNRWNLFLEYNQGSSALAETEEPRTLEISYSPGGQICHEIVYEDPTETTKRPRLLVSLQSVLALKALCEREFERVEIITDVLKKCRVKYYKELCYLREQLYRTTRPQFEVDHVYNYEVYWFEPPEYIDHDFKVFLQECIRITNKKLIEENYDLVRKLSALGANTATLSDDDHIKRMINSMGPGSMVRKLYGFLQTPEHGSDQKRKDFEMAINDIMKKYEKEEVVDDGASDEKLARLEAQLKKLMQENEKLKKSAEEAEGLRQRCKELERENAALERGGQSAAAQEAARADAEKARADAAESERLKLEMSLKALKDKEIAMMQQVKAFSSRIDAAVTRLDKTYKKTGGPGEGILGPLESSITGLEGVIVGCIAKMNSASSSASSNDAALQAQLKAAADRDAKYKLEIERLQKEAKRLKEERDAMALEAAEADARAKRASTAAASDDNSEELNRLREELKNAQGEVSRLKGELEQNEKDYFAKFKALESQLREAEAKAKMSRGNSGNKEAIEELERALAEMTEKYERGQMKIHDLKEQIKRLKAKCGEPVDDSDSDDSDYDGEMPFFLMSYVKRTRGAIKPRWKHLSDDAKYASQKRDFLFAQAHANMRDVTRESYGEAADEAFNFLRQKENQRVMTAQRAMTAQSQRPAARATMMTKAKTTTFDDDKDPVEKALRAQRALTGELLTDQEVLQNASSETGHPLSKFKKISSGPRSYPSLEAAVGISASELGRPGTSSKPGTAENSPTKKVTMANEEHFPPPPTTGQQASREVDIGIPSLPQTQYGHVASPTHRAAQASPTHRAAHETYESLMNIAGHERAAPTGAVNTGRAATPQQRQVAPSGRQPPMIISNLDAIGGTASSATIRAYDRTRIANIANLPGSRSPSGSPDRHFPLSTESRSSTPTGRGRQQAPLRSQRSVGSQASSHSPASPEIRNTEPMGTRGRASAPSRNQAQHVSPPRSSRSLALVESRPEAESHQSPPRPQAAAGQGLRRVASESALQQSFKRPVQQSYGEAAVREAVEAGTLSSMLSPGKSRASKPKQTADTFLQEASISSVGSTTLPAELSIESSLSSPSRDRLAPKRAPLKMAGKMTTTHSRSLPSSSTPPAGLSGRGKSFPPITSQSNSTYGSGPASFSPPLGEDSPLARASQEKLMSSTYPAPNRASPKALKQRRLYTAGDQAPPPRESTWGMSISKSMGSLPFTNVKSALSTMSTTSSSISPTKSKFKVDTGAEDVNSKGHLPVLMPDFKPGKVHKGPLGPTSTLYVATV